LLPPGERTARVELLAYCLHADAHSAMGAVCSTIVAAQTAVSSFLVESCHSTGVVYSKSPCPDVQLSVPPAPKKIRASRVGRRRVAGQRTKSSSRHVKVGTITLMDRRRRHGAPMAICSRHGVSATGAHCLMLHMSRRGPSVGVMTGSIVRPGICSTQPHSIAETGVCCRHAPRPH